MARGEGVEQSSASLLSNVNIKSAPAGIKLAGKVSNYIIQKSY